MARLSLDALQGLIDDFIDDLQELIPNPMAPDARDEIAEDICDLVTDRFPDFDYSYN